MDLQHADYFEDFNNKLIRQNDDYINIYSILFHSNYYFIFSNFNHRKYKKYFYLLRYDYNTLC